MPTAKKKAPSRSRKALAAQAVDVVRRASGLTSGMGRWRHEQEIEEKFAMLHPKAQKALLSYLEAQYASEDASAEEWRMMSHPRYDYGGYPLPSWLVSKVRAAGTATKEARERFVQLATAKTRKARKVAKKKPMRGKVK